MSITSNIVLRVLSFACAKTGDGICRAVELEEEDAAELLLASHADALKTVFRGPDTTTALHKAIEMGSLKFVKRFTELWRLYAGAQSVHPVTMDIECNGVTPLLK